LNKRSLSFLFLFLASFFASPLVAQQTLGSINGTVTDTSDAAVPESTVTVSDPAINITRVTHSQGNGTFQVFNLPPGSYQIQVSHDGFETTQVAGIQVQEAQAKTVAVKLKVGQISTSVEVTADSLLNATDSTNGNTFDSAQIAETPLATGSFTQLAPLSPGVNAELLSSLDSNAGLGNQNIWANGQRATSNTFQFNGVDSSNIFNGLTASNLASQRWNFNIGEGGKIAGSSQTSTSSFGSIGNSLPSAPTEFIQEMRVNTSSYDAQQGATSGAQIDVNTLSGTNNWHGQAYGTFANNSMNAAPFFYKQQALLAQEGIGAFPESLANPELHRWTTGGTFSGPILKNKLFFFVGFQHMYVSDQSTAISQLNVPSGLTDDRSTAGIDAALTSWNAGTQVSSINPIAMNLLQTKLPNGQYLIPSAQTSAPYAYGVPNVTLVGTSVMTGNQAAASLDYDLTQTDRLSFKYYYQNDPTTKPYGVSETGGFPSSQNNASQVGVVDNTISIGSRINWEQRIGFSRMGNYSYFNQTVTDPSAAYGPTFGIGGSGIPGYLDTNTMPGLSLGNFASKSTLSPSLSVGPESAFINTGFYQNRLNPSSNLILSLGQHTLFIGGGYSYTQLNIENGRSGNAIVDSRNFEDFLEGTTYGKGTSVLDTIDPSTGKNNADRYYRSNEVDGYVQDKWQVRSDLTITAGVRYDYHGGLTEKYGNLFNFDPSAYNVSGTDTTGFTVVNSGFVVAGNNKSYPGAGVSDSTLNGRQWGISPRVGFAWSPKRDEGKLVVRGGAGIYYDRGELFSYLSQPAGSGTGGPFGATESAPLASYVIGAGTTLGNPFGSALPLSGTTSPPLPSANPATMNNALQAQLNAMTAGTGSYGPNCGGVGQQEDEYCPAPLNFGAYDKNNVLPYVINFNFNIQWQPTNDMAITIGYAGNRGRHSVIPIPFNEAQIATPSSPAMIQGANPHPGSETDSYGFEVLNQNVPADKYGDYAPIKSEPWSTYDGGNVDFRAPYVGYNPNAVLFETVGESAYDALQTHLEKRLSHYYQVGASYTWSHSLDEQSDLGLFFTGNNPNNLRSSWASSDFDRTNVFSGNFLAQLPNAAHANTWLSYLTNDWNMTGIGILQSGQPYSLYEYNGAVGSAYVGNYPSLMNPVLPIKDPAQVRQAMTGNKGSFRGAGGNYIPAIDPTQIDINYLQPGEKGVPTAAQGNAGDPLDTYETDFAPSNQRNIFRQSAQKRLDISFRKSVKIKDRVTIQYAFNIFNVTNTTSLDVPQNQTQIRQTSYTCSATAMAVSGSNCANEYTYGQVVTNQADQATNNGRGTAGLALDQLPYVNGTGKSITIPTTLPVGVGSCTAATTAGGCPNNGADFGSVTGTIGGGRAVTMGLHITY
jgi:Carboxypeptidase regulatory-like domain